MGGCRQDPARTGGAAKGSRGGGEHVRRGSRWVVWWIEQMRRSKGVQTEVGGSGGQGLDHVWALLTGWECLEDSPRRGHW